jgi:hypothetical protein
MPSINSLEHVQKMFNSFIHAGPPKKIKRSALTSKQYQILAGLLPMTLFPTNTKSVQQKALKYLKTIPPDEIPDHELYTKIATNKVSVSNIRTALSKRNQSTVQTIGKYIEQSFVLDTHLLSPSLVESHRQFMQALFEQYRYTVIKEMKKKEKKELQQIPKYDQTKLKKQIENCKTPSSHTAKISALKEHMSYNIQKYTQQLKRANYRTVLEKRQRPDDDAYIKQKVSESNSKLNCLERLEQLLVVQLKQHDVQSKQMLAVKSRLKLLPNDIWIKHKQYVQELNSIIAKLKQAGKHQEAAHEQRLLNDRVLFNTLWIKQLSTQEEIDKLKQHVQWAASIYNEPTIRKHILKILRKGYLLKKMRGDEVEEIVVRTRLEKYKIDLNTMIKAKDWQMLYTYSHNSGWSTDVDDSEYLAYFSCQWTARVSKQAQIRREMATRQKEMENTVVLSELEQCKTSSFKLFQLLRMINLK